MSVNPPIPFFSHNATQPSAGRHCAASRFQFQSDTAKKRCSDALAEEKFLRRCVGVPAAGHRRAQRRQPVKSANFAGAEPDDIAAPCE